MGLKLAISHEEILLKLTCASGLCELRVDGLRRRRRKPPKSSPEEDENWMSAAKSQNDESGDRETTKMRVASQTQGDTKDPKPRHHGQRLVLNNQLQINVVP